MPIEWGLHKRRWLSWRRKRFWGVALALLYGLGGFFLLPPLLKPQIVSALQKSLDRPVALDGVSVNPLLLSADLRGLRIAEKDGSPLVGFDRLHVRLALDSLFHWAWSFGNISLEGLNGQIIRYGQSDTNVGRLMPAGPAKPDKQQGAPRLIIHHLSLKGARLAFTDQVPATPFKTMIGPVNAEIDSFSTLPDETGRQHIAIALEKGATLDWSSQSSLDPLISSGHVKASGPYLPLVARYLGDALKIEVPKGTIEAELDYRLQERADGVFGLSVDHAGFVLKEAVAGDFLTLPELRLTGGHLSWPEREAGADSLSVDGLDIALLRQADGRIGPMPVPAQQGEGPPSAKAGWSVSLGKAEIKNAKAHFEDRSLHEAGKVEVTSFDFSANALSNKPDAAFPFALTAALAPGGSVKLQGKASVAPSLGVDAKLVLAGLPIALAQPYLHDMAKLAIDEGTLEAESEVKLHDPDGLKIAGQAAVKSLKLKDEVEQTPVIAWDSLSIDHYSYYQSANELRISQVTLSSPYLHFQKAADQSTNFSHILIPAAPAKAPAPAAGKAAAPLKISVGKIAVATGGADYSDASLPLPFATHIANLHGHIQDLSSAANSASGVSLQGQVDQYGEADIYGKVDPFHASKGMKINVVFRNVDFPGLSPYSAKFAGRRIAKGKLDIESQYSVDNGTLNGTNKVVIRDLELGEKVDVPGALDLPLELAVSLLKDDEGKIAIDLPVSGNVNDPQFDFGAVISNALADLLGNLVTAPFRALAGLFGSEGGDKLDHIDFVPGRAGLEPPEKEKLQHVAEILQKRPQIDLAVTGVTDPDADRQRLQRDALDAEMTKELGDRNTVDRQRRYLETQFEKKIGADKLAAVKQTFPQEDDPAYISALRKEVAKTEPVDEKGLAALAQSRAKAVADALKQIPGFDPKRVTIQGTKEVKAEEDGRIPMKFEAAKAGN